MNVRAKFRVSNVHHLAGDGTVAQISLFPVYADGKANDQWSKATPSGQIQMTITNPIAIEAFELGKEYFVDFSPAD